mmetsp:Transcript_10018/g.29654  ORF Transcript_10018/g.29654 Transcript_10018/m.29654 type:complete len:227 (-) Transcript_10018:487-1167(-)
MQGSTPCGGPTRGRRPRTELSRPHRTRTRSYPCRRPIAPPPRAYPWWLHGRGLGGSGRPPGRTNQAKHCQTRLRSARTRASARPRTPGPSLRSTRRGVVGWARPPGGRAVKAREAAAFPPWTHAARRPAKTALASLSRTAPTALPPHPPPRRRRRVRCAPVAVHPPYPHPRPRPRPQAHHCRLQQLQRRPPRSLCHSQRRGQAAPGWATQLCPPRGWRHCRVCHTQ